MHQLTRRIGAIAAGILLALIVILLTTLADPPAPRLALPAPTAQVPP